MAKASLGRLPIFVVTVEVSTSGESTTESVSIPSAAVPRAVDSSRMSWLGVKGRLASAGIVGAD